MRLQNVIAFDTEPLYDRIALPSALSAGEYKFFVVPAGQNDPQSATQKKVCETNIRGSGGRLPEPEAFEILGFALVPDFLALRADVAILYNASYFEIRLGGNATAAHRVPTRIVTGGTGLPDTTATGSVVGTPAPQFIQSLPPDASVIIKMNENFEAALIVCTGQTLTTNNLGVMCLLYGIHAKAVRKA